MTDNDQIQSAIATWARKGLPARIDVTQTAKLLGFAEHDIPILMAARKLIPLGEPATNAPKFFAAVEVIQFTMDKEWLHKATKEVSRRWRDKRSRRLMPPTFPKRTSSDEKASPRSSPDDQVTNN
jgi:hypothetical protein